MKHGASLTGVYRGSEFLPYTGRAPLKLGNVGVDVENRAEFPSLYWEGPIEALGELSQNVPLGRISFPILGGPH